MKTLLLIGIISITTKFVGVNNNNQEVSQNKKEPVVDLVCKMKIDANSKTTLNYEHEKVNYSFCSDLCKKTFIKQPNKYIKKQK